MLQSIANITLVVKDYNVDTENLSGATHVYEACGFQVKKRNTVYRKPF